MTIRGSCHCGAVRFEIEHQVERVTICNCSLCRRTGYLHVYVQPAQFRLLTSPGALTAYRFGTERAEHLFCSTCGISAFRHPRSDPDLFNVNARCLEGLDTDALPIDRFDGQDWEQAQSAGQLEPLRKG